MCTGDGLRSSFEFSQFDDLSDFVMRSNTHLLVLGIDGPVDSKHICGTRTAGMSLRTRKADKVSLLYFFFHCTIIFIFYHFNFELIPFFLVFMGKFTGRQ